MLIILISIYATEDQLQAGKEIDCLFCLKANNESSQLGARSRRYSLWKSERRSSTAQPSEPTDHEARYNAVNVTDSNCCNLFGIVSAMSR